jgi:hypothetical protein
MVPTHLDERHRVARGYSLRVMIDLFRRVKVACGDTLRPPPGLTAAQVRKNGAVAAALGLVLVLATAGAPMALDRLPVHSILLARAVLVLMFLPYALFVIGGYRLVTGKGLEQTRYGAGASLARIVTGVVFVFGSMAVLLGLLIIVGYALGMK